jgi:hypothetical protein
MTLINENEISSDQEEVWSWKKSIHNEIQDMEISEGLRYILEKAKNTMDEQFQLKDNIAYTEYI